LIDDDHWQSRLQLLDVYDYLLMVVQRLQMLLMLVLDV
jgi:hypothetical protein